MSCCNNQSASYSPSTIAKGIIGLSKVALGIGIADKAIIQSRRDKCRVCEHASRNSSPQYAKFNGLTSFSKCKLCLCYIKAKTQLITEKCPENKWSK